MSKAAGWTLVFVYLVIGIPVVSLWRAEFIRCNKEDASYIRLIVTNLLWPVPLTVMASGGLTIGCKP